MIFTPNTLRVDRSAYPVIESPAPFFSWGASHERPGASQTACRITVERYTDTVWDSGWVETPRQSMPYGGPALCENSAYRWTLRLRDDAGVESASAEGRFVTALTGPWTAPWIAAEDRPGRAPYFRREFTARVDVVRAVLYVCGVGYQLVTLNGERVDDAVLQPVVSDYSKTCYYTVLDVTDWLVPGDNCLGVVLGEGPSRSTADRS